MPRIPLPVKLFLSYLCILLLGAGPTVYYISKVLPGDIMSEAARQLSERAKRLAHKLGEVSAAERLESVRAVGQLSPDRLSYLSPQGDVLFDNEIPADTMPDNHANRPEIRQALGDTAVSREKFARDPHFDGMGVARRVSATRNVDTLYVAVRVATADNEPAAVLRLATPIDKIESMSVGIVRLIRNATAVAVTAAIGFSLIAEAAHLGHFTEGAVPKGYLYFAIFFSLFVEFLNLKMRKAQKPIQLHGYGETAKKRGLLDEDLLDGEKEQQ